MNPFNWAYGQETRLITGPLINVKYKSGSSCLIQECYRNDGLVSFIF